MNACARCWCECVCVRFTWDENAAAAASLCLLSIRLLMFHCMQKINNRHLIWCSVRSTCTLFTEFDTTENIILISRYDEEYMYICIHSYCFERPNHFYFQRKSIYSPQRHRYTLRPAPKTLYSPLLQLNIITSYLYLNIQKKERNEIKHVSFFTALSLRSILFKSQ